jgi:ABC-type bacteriocin/lantibiotic exporter with double-glycine peptidase domain
MLSMCASVFAAESSVWLDVPFVKQDKDGCGAATIAMVMQYWQQQLGQPIGPSSDAVHILHTLYSGDAHGIYASAMTRYFQKNGYRTFAFTGEWGDLERHLQKGRPLIAALQPQSGDSLHYVVVAGVDQQHQLVLLNDPAQRKLLKEDRSTFEQEWKATGNWTLLAVPQASRSH